MLYTFLKERMREYPDRVLRDANGEITYRELLCDSQRCAKDLRDRKYGIYCKSEINTVRALFACLCAQKTAVMMSPRYGPIHNEKIIRQMEISVLITDDGIHRLTRPTAESEDLSDVALILSTSGTTGAPKGAMITHQNLITNLCDIERYFTIDAQDRIMITRPLYHCAVLTGELLISLCKGLNIFFWNVEFNPQAILKQLCLEKATVFCATPTLLYYLSRFAARQGLCPPLKTIAVSGECMTAKTAGQIIRFAPNAKIPSCLWADRSQPSRERASSGTFWRLPYVGRISAAQHTG